jgi:hypothetical protein
MFGTNTLIAGLMRDREYRGMISNESEDTSGRTAAEIERVIYARVSNFDFLDKASGAERQEQWSIKVAKTEENAGSGSIRVRKTTNLREPGASVQYVLTSKLDVGGKGHSAETSEQSTVDQFNIFKYMANKGMLKDRYTFPIPGSDLIWEVDCFPKPGEMYFEWVKIDLEKWPSGKELPQLPFAVAEMMDGDPGQQSEETKAKISRLYQDVFLIANTKEPLSSYAEEGSGQPGVAKESIQETGTDPGAETNGSKEGDAERGAAADGAVDSGQGDDPAKAEGGTGGNTDDSEGGDGDGVGGGDEGSSGSGEKPAGKADEGNDDSSADGKEGADKGEGEG